MGGLFLANFLIMPGKLSYMYSYMFDGDSVPQLKEKKCKKYHSGIKPCIMFYFLQGIWKKKEQIFKSMYIAKGK